MLDTILLTAALIYITADFIFDRARAKKIKNIEDQAAILKSLFDKSNNLNALSLEELNQFFINRTRSLELNTSKDIQGFNADLDRTIASIDSIQEKIAELEVIVQNIANGLRH